MIEMYFDYDNDMIILKENNKELIHFQKVNRYDYSQREIQSMFEEVINRVAELVQVYGYKDKPISLDFTMTKQSDGERFNIGDW